MTAPARRVAAVLLDHWLHADEIRADWQDTGLATTPADRPAAEDHLTRLYARVGRPRPRFHWVDSPAAALPVVRGLPHHDELLAGRPSVMSDLVTAWSRLAGSLDDAADDPVLTAPRGVKKGGKPWPALPPREALEAGLPLQEVLRRLGFARWSAADDAHLDDWAALARATGWWWPDEDRCVLVERPVAPARWGDGFGVR